MQEQWKDAYPGVTGQILSYAMKAISRDPEQGSYSTLWALSSSEIEEKRQNGAYFSDPGKVGDESPQASDAKLGTELWQLSENLVREKLGESALVSWESSGVD
ncbi:hypothetical protein J3459_017521 [Metarhizium acridum]|nr:hypothetical protein J3459_017521 [Metarhizium acridum]